MPKTRAFEYVLVALVVLVLVGVFGHHVLITHQKLAGARLTAAYHAMQTALILAHTRCQVDSALECGSGQVVALREGLRIRMKQGYPAASADGIVVAAGLATDVYRLDYTGEGLLLGLKERAIDTECRVVYAGPTGEQLQALVTLRIAGC